MTFGWLPTATEARCSSPNTAYEILMVIVLNTRSWRALRDMAARVLGFTDRPGVETWGFRRIARLDRDLAMFRPFCA